jgi:hypothetical protein
MRGIQSMLQNLKYSSTLTGASFLFYELKQVINLKNQSLSDMEIKQKVRLENVFQYNKKSSSKRSFPSIIRRMHTLDSYLCQLILDETLEIGKSINLYAIMKTDRLFFEFMEQIISAKLKAGDYLLEKKELNLFFTTMAEQDATIASWSTENVARLKQAYFKILLEAGFLKDKKTDELNHLNLDEGLKRHLIAIGDAVFVRAMGE